MRSGRYPRPTLRCLTSIGEAKAPPATLRLSELNHPLLAKAREVTEAAPGARERIVELDDRVFYKVKIGRWRAALLIVDGEAWIVAAGLRREGDADDFYRDLGEDARRWRAEYNRDHSPTLTTNTHTDRLLPTQADRDRLVLEDALAVVDDLRDEVAALTRESASSGREARGEAAGCELGILLLRSEIGEIYVAIRVVARTPQDVNTTYGIILDALRDIVDPAGWFIDTMPNRPSDPGEVIWSNVVDEDELDRFLRQG